jgi:hypothetical protein
MSVVTSCLTLSLLCFTLHARASTTTESRILPSVDLVYTFVNGSDPVWLDKYVKNTNLSNISCDRFQCTNEIVIALLSVQKHMDWVTKVYIAVDNQTIPLDFLEPSFREKIKLVDHKEFVDHSYLPTFNSFVIEAFIHRIQGLSEHFIYLNDDMIFTFPMNKSNFFTEDGSFLVHVKDMNNNTHKWLSDARIPIADNLRSEVWQYSRFSAARLFMGKFNYTPQWLDSHSAYILRRTAQQHTFSMFAAVLEPTYYNKIRVYNDVKHHGNVHFTVLSQYIAVHMGLMKPSKTVLRVWNMHGSSKVLHQSSFGLKYDVICLQYFYNMTTKQLVSYCHAAMLHWCPSPSIYCSRFLLHCSTHIECNTIKHHLALLRRSPPCLFC